MDAHTDRADAQILVPTERNLEWASTMQGGSATDGVVCAHRSSPPKPLVVATMTRERREELERLHLATGAALSSGAGVRAVDEEPDPLRTCFERDRDRIRHATAFRRLAGKTQVFVYPSDHQRTRLTHALEVAQVASAIASAIGLNVALTEAIALGHDCGHGPGGHASEDAFDPFVPGGYHHAIWGAEVTLAPLNLCVETLDGIRNHSWSQPTPMTAEGICVSLSDRYAYCAHDVEDAVRAGVVAADDLPPLVRDVLGTRRSSQLRALVNATVDTVARTGVMGLDPVHAEALAQLRAFNYERIYMRNESLAQADAVVRVLRALVEFFAADVSRLPDDHAVGADPQLAAVAYVSGMTDRFAFESAVSLLGWDRDRLPRGVDMPLPRA